jgi:predicted lipid-binding transport protein (Tim44 family)
VSTSDNYGVQITGSHVYGSAIAGGQGAHAEAQARDITVTNQGPQNIDDLRTAIAALVELVRAAAPGDDEAMLTQIAESVQAEADKAEPSKGKLQRLLGMLVAGAGGVASIVNAAAVIQHAVGLLF